MPNFRRNHTRSGMTPIVSKVVFVLLILFLMIVAITRYFMNSDQPNSVQQPVNNDEIITADYLPVGGDKGELVLNKFFTISYNEKHEQPNWVAYELLADQLNKPSVSRDDMYFYADERVSTQTAEWYDYKETSYTRGHLVPAGDRSWSVEAIKETFLMSNISPQKKEFNGGIWRELEENIRNWAREMGHLYIVSGPIFDNNCTKGDIGKTTNITVPCDFFKAILYIDEDGEGHYIGFVLPNEMSTKPLIDYVVTIDEIEEKLDMDMFKSLVSNEKEGESIVDMDRWSFDDKKFKTRLNTWNKR